MAELTRKEIVKMIAAIPVQLVEQENKVLVGRLCGLNLRGLNLSRIDFSNIDFFQSDLRGANLRDCYFQHAQLWNAKLDGADLTGACLESCDAQRASFVGARLVRIHGSELDAEDSIFDGADLTDAMIFGARFPGASFKKTKLVNVDARGALLGRNNWDGAIVKGGDWSECEAFGEGSELVLPAGVTGIRTTLPARQATAV